MVYRIKIFFYRLCSLLPIKKNRILFFSYYGGNYGGSPKYLSEYFILKECNYQIIWAFNQTEKYCNLKGTTIVKFNSFRYFYYLATSHFIITNYRMTLEFKKRDKQKYIQTWHSSLRLKMIEKDVENTLPNHYVDMAKNDSRQIDLLLSGSQKSQEIFERSFWYDGEYLKCGTPQCDLFFSKSVHFKQKIYDYFKIDKNKKIVLYAPTFRKNNSLQAYDIDYERLLKTLNLKFKDDWVILIRLHPHLINLVQNIKFNNTIINATKYDDIQELLQVVDMVITDYSALMFDYILTKKPCFLYVNDLAEYISQDRKLYFDLEELPFPCCYDNNQLNENIMNFDLEKYVEACNLFLKDNIVSWENGTACQQVVNYIEMEMK